MVLLYKITAPIVNSLNFFINCIYEFYRVNCFIGALLFNAISTCVRLVYYGIANILLGLQVLIEDFGHFIADLDTLISEFWDLVVDTADILYCCLLRFFRFMTDIGEFVEEEMTVIKPLKEPLEKSYSQLEKPFLLVKDSLLFIGYCVWQVFQLIFLIFSYLNDAPYLFVLFLTRKLDDLIQFVYRLPLESLAGLGILNAVVYLLYKTNPNITKDCKRLCVLLFRKVKNKTIRLTINIFSYLTLTILKTVSFTSRMIGCMKRVVSVVIEGMILKTQTKAALRIELEREKAEKVCVVCLDNKRDTMLLPCKHLLMCARCAFTIAMDSGDCPVCRTEISEILNVYT